MTIIIYVLAAYGALSLTASVAAIAAIVVAARAPRPRDDTEALIEATREEHPHWRDWDIRELTP